MAVVLSVFLASVHVALTPSFTVHLGSAHPLGEPKTVCLGDPATNPAPHFGSVLNVIDFSVYTNIYLLVSVYL